MRGEGEREEGGGGGRERKKKLLGHKCCSVSNINRVQSWNLV